MHAIEVENLKIEIQFLKFLRNCLINESFVIRLTEPTVDKITKNTFYIFFKKRILKIVFRNGNSHQKALKLTLKHTIFCELIYLFRN